MSSRTKGSNEQRTVKNALLAAGGTIEASCWSEVRKGLNLQMNTANVQATVKALCGRGDIKHTVMPGSFVLVLT